MYSHLFNEYFILSYKRTEFKLCLYEKNKIGLSGWAAAKPRRKALASMNGEGGVPALGMMAPWGLVTIVRHRPKGVKRIAGGIYQEITPSPAHSSTTMPRTIR